MASSPTFDQGQQEERQPPRRIGLNEILAGVRFVESGSYEGDYSRIGPRFSGRSYYGAYQISTDYWAEWAAIAGISGADMRSKQAQDYVAAYIMGDYYQRFGSWDLAAMAWLAGPQEAAKLLRRGYSGIDSIQNPKIRDYVTAVSTQAQWAAENPNEAFTQLIPSTRFAEATPGNGWVNPVAGTSEYSNSFRVPRDNTAGIHGAIDIYAAQGTPIVSPVGGKILSTKKGNKGGYTVQIEGDDGIVYYFAHMAEAAVVGVGDRVFPGYHVGYVGDTGNARGTSPHLHMSMRRNGALVNPFSYLEQASSMSVTQAPTENLSVVRTTDGQRAARTMNTWLQDMSNSVRAGAIDEPVEEVEDDELDDKQTQTASRKVVSGEKGPY